MMVDSTCFTQNLCRRSTRERTLHGVRNAVSPVYRCFFHDECARSASSQEKPRGVLTTALCAQGADPDSFFCVCFSLFGATSSSLLEASRRGADVGADGRAGGLVSVVWVWEAHREALSPICVGQVGRGHHCAVQPCPSHCCRSADCAAKVLTHPGGLPGSSGHRLQPRMKACPSAFWVLMW